MGLFTRQLNRLVCWPGECTLKTQTRFETTYLGTVVGNSSNWNTSGLVQECCSKSKEPWGKTCYFCSHLCHSHTYLILRLSSCGILGTHTSKIMGQQPLLLWALKKQQLVPEYHMTLAWMRSVTNLSDSMLNTSQADTMEDFQILKGSTEGNKTCGVPCVMLNQLISPHPWTYHKK